MEWPDVAMWGLILFFGAVMFHGWPGGRDE